MKKLFGSIFILIVLAAIAAGASAFYVSGMSEQRFKSFVAFINTNDAISTELVSFNKGIFISEAITRSKPKFLNTEQYIEVKHSIWNGPIVYTGKKEKPFDFLMARVVSVAGKLPESLELVFTVKTDMAFDGEVNSVTEGSNFIFTSEQFKVQFQNWHSTAHLNANNWNTIKGDGVIPAVSIEAFGMVFDINNMTSAVDLKKSTLGNWLGNSSLDLEKLSSKLVGSDLTNFTSKEASVLENDLINVNWKVAFDKFTFAKLDYGPLNLDIQINHLDPTVLVEFKNSSNAPKNQQSQFKPEFYQKFLLKRPGFAIKDSTLLVPDGMIKLDMEMEVGGSDIVLPLDNDAVLKTIDGHFMLTLPKTIFRMCLGAGVSDELNRDLEFQKLDDEHKKQSFEQKVDLKIDKLKTDQILTEQENNFSIKVSIEKGKWMANGKETPQPFAKPTVPEKQAVPEKQGNQPNIFK